jgi:hypothetical protein
MAHHDRYSAEIPSSRQSHSQGASGEQRSSVTARAQHKGLGLLGMYEIQTGRVSRDWVWDASEARLTKH